MPSLTVFSRLTVQWITLKANVTADLGLYLIEEPMRSIYVTTQICFLNLRFGRWHLQGQPKTWNFQKNQHFQKMQLFTKIVIFLRKIRCFSHSFQVPGYHRVWFDDNYVPERVKTENFGSERSSKNSKIFKVGTNLSESVHLSTLWMSFSHAVTNFSIFALSFWLDILNVFWNEFSILEKNFRSVF